MEFATINRRPVEIYTLFTDVIALEYISKFDVNFKRIEDYLSILINPSMNAKNIDEMEKDFLSFLRSKVNSYFKKIGFSDIIAFQVDVISTYFDKPEILLAWKKYKTNPRDIKNIKKFFDNFIFSLYKILTTKKVSQLIKGDVPVEEVLKLVLCRFLTEEYADKIRGEEYLMTGIFEAFLMNQSVSSKVYRTIKNDAEKSELPQMLAEELYEGKNDSSFSRELQNEIFKKTLFTTTMYAEINIFLDTIYPHYDMGYEYAEFIESII